jgi:hypothetical protein
MRECDAYLNLTAIANQKGKTELSCQTSFLPTPSQNVEREPKLRFDQIFNSSYHVDLHDILFLLYAPDTEPDHRAVPGFSVFRNCLPVHPL